MRPSIAIGLTALLAAVSCEPAPDADGGDNIEAVSPLANATTSVGDPRTPDAGENRASASERCPGHCGPFPCIIVKEQPVCLSPVGGLPPTCRVTGCPPGMHCQGSPFAVCVSDQPPPTTSASTLP